MGKAIHSQRLERLLGAAQVESIQKNLRRWYGPPVPIALPGKRNRVFAHADGHFSGELNDGFFVSTFDMLEERGKRLMRSFAQEEVQAALFVGGWSGVVDFLRKGVNGGRRRIYPFVKVGTAGSSTRAESLFRVGSYPAAGAAPSNAPGGDAPTSATGGALNISFDNAITNEFEFFLTATLQCFANNFGLILYDRIFEVNKTMNSTATEAVTGVPTRYQSTTATDWDYVGGNFVFMETQTVLAAVAHNWTVCQYTNQAGTTGQSIPSVTGVSACPVNAHDMPGAMFFADLAAGDTGIKALTQMQCSALVTSGAIAFVMGHLLGWLPAPLGSWNQIVGAINTSFQLARIFDNACLALLEAPKGAANAVTWTGSLQTNRG